MNISGEAVPYEAVAEASLAIGDDDVYALLGWEGVTRLLEAAAPYMLSHERQQTADAHRDAMVNRETSQALLAEAWDEGFDRGFYDPLAGSGRDASESLAGNPYETRCNSDEV